MSESVIDKARKFALQQYPDAKGFGLRVTGATWFNFHCGLRGATVLVEVATACSVHVDTRMHLKVCVCENCEYRPSWKEEPSYYYGI